MYRELYRKVYSQTHKVLFLLCKPCKYAGLQTLWLCEFVSCVNSQNCVGAIFTCKQCLRNSFTRKTPAGSLLYKIKLILYMQKLGWWLWRLLRTAFNFCGQRGSRQLCWPPKASAPPYALFIFPKTRKHFDVTRAKPRLWQGFLMLQRTHFLYVRMGAICSIARFWTFSISKCVMYLRRHSVEGDAGSARVRDPHIIIISIMFPGVVPDVDAGDDGVMIGTGYVAIYA